MENMGLNKMIKKLRELNPTVKFDVHDRKVSPSIIIIGTVPARELSFPNGYYWNEKNGITDKHNTDSGLYECFNYKYDPTHFVTAISGAQVKPVKKSFLSRIFGFG